MTRTYTTHAIAEMLSARLIGDGDIAIERVAHPADVRSARDLALAMDKNLLPLLAKGPARAVVIGEDAAPAPGFMDACIVVGRSRLAMAKLTRLFAEPVPLAPGIHPSAVIEKGAQLGDNVAVGAFAYIGAGATIGANSAIHPQAYIGPDAAIGKDALIHAGARIGSRVVLGDRCIVHFNACIGADGFSFVTPEPGSVEAAKATGAVAATNRELVRIASLGSVLIGDDVEIGAATSIDRGTVASTRIGNGTKIDNQVQIGHNVTIGENCLICGRVGIAGSVVIGDRVVMGGASGIADHLKIGDDAVVMAMAGIAGNVAPKSIVGGIPAQPRARLLESYFYNSRLKHYLEKIGALARRVDALEQKNRD